jgi:arsenite-transporting ATPase
MTQFIFFSGKGGVGKTSMACTTAVRYADEGKRTLIVTTDPASNLADVFEHPIGHKITPIEGVPNLSAMEIDSDRATEEYKDRALAPIRAAFPPQIIQVMEEQMNGPCTAEVAAFDRFTDFLEAPTGGMIPYEVIIFDTAPTGHTLRLLELPAEWSRSITEAEHNSGQTCIGPAAAIQDAKRKYERALATLRDATQTTFIFVLHPEITAIKETKRATVELGKLDIYTHQIIINGIIPPEEATNPLFAARMTMQSAYLAQIEREIPLPAQRMFLLDSEIKGVTRLREVGKALFEGQRYLSIPQLMPEAIIPSTVTPLNEVLVRLLPNGHGQTRTVFFAGKGGVGKTIASCMTAVWLARQGYKTLLLTTDPAAHLGDVLGVPVTNEVIAIAEVPNLWATKIDPKAASEIYKARILEDARQRGRSSDAIRAMAEELDSPCTEEMAAFDRFIAYASQEGWQAIIFDTAPTGHTLRLLELPLDWSKQIDVKVFSTVDSTVADDIAKQRFGQVIKMMRDPARSTFAFVMYPEATPIAEAKRAIDELATLNIPLGLVVANLVLPIDVCTTPFTRSRRTMQEKYLADMATLFAAPILQIPLLTHEVKGLEVLIALGEQVYGDGRSLVIEPTQTEVILS